MWRFVVERVLTDKDEDQVFLIGYIVYQEKICQWVYGSSSGPVLAHSVDRFTFETRELPSAEVDVREDSIRKNRDAQNE